MIYMDYSATSYVKDEVFNEMAPYFKDKFGNASSIHAMGREARKAVDAAREKCAKAIGAKQTSEIFFTSGGTESDNMAIRGVCAAYAGKGKHIITSTLEHHAVLHTFEEMAKQGFEVTYVPADEKGILDMDAFKKAIRPDTIFVSIMFANNEIGTIQPINEIGDICREKGIVFHTDAVQAMGNVSIDVDKLNVDMMSISGHKIYAPKGICASSGSACTSGSLDPSHVLLGIGLDHQTAHGSIRFSLGDGNTMEDIDYVIEVLPGILENLRAMSPLYELEGGVKNV